MQSFCLKTLRPVCHPSCEKPLLLSRHPERTRASRICGFALFSTSLFQTLVSTLASFSPHLAVKANSSLVTSGTSRQAKPATPGHRRLALSRTDVPAATETTRRLSGDHWPAALHVSDTCFTLITLKTCSSFAEDAAPWTVVSTVLIPGFPVISTV